MSTTFISELSPPAIVSAHMDSRTWSCDVTSRDRVKSRDYGLSCLNRSPAAGKRRKRVRFADTVGLPLVQSKEFKAGDELDLSFTSTFLPPSTSVPVLQLCFTLPATNPLSHHSVLFSHIKLSSAVPRGNTLSGTLLIHNVCFQKEVFARFSTDRWITNSDTPCFFLRSLDPQVDVFEFNLVVSEFVVGRELEFCLCFRTEDGAEYWDNNYSRNYKVMVVEEVGMCEVSLSGLGLGRRDSVRSVSPYW